MTDNRTNLEIIAPSIEEAIEEGLANLGLPEDAVEIEVLDEGTKGLFGSGFPPGTYPYHSYIRY